MTRKIQFKRGLKANLPKLSPAEMAFTTDEKKAYIGDGNENIRLLDQKDKADITTQLEGTVKEVNGVKPTNGKVTIPVPEVDTSKLATKQDVQQLSLAFKESYATLSALQTAYPTGDNANHAVLSDNMIYTYKNGWVSTGIQANGTGITPSSVNREKLADDFNYVAQLDGVDLNTVTKEGSYVILASCTNKPSEIVSTSIMVVKNSRGLYIHQTIYDRYDLTKTFTRRMEPSTNSYGEWLKNITTNNLASVVIPKSLDNTKLSDTFNHNGTVSNVDMKTLNREGYYVVANGTDKPVQDTSGLLKVSAYGGTIIQDYISYVFPNSKEMYRRIKRSGESFSEWFMTSPSLNQGFYKFQKESVFHAGDSITGGTGYHEIVKKRLGINAINGGFAGTRLTFHTNADYDKFSFTKLVDAKINNNFSSQDDAFTRISITNGEPNLTNWKNTDFTKLEYMTIWYGTNDFGGDIFIGENDSEDTTTIKGALNYSIKRLLTAYPQLKILVITPMFRQYLTGNSDDTPNQYRNLYLRDYVEAIQEVAQEKHHLPCLDMYDESGINKYNHTYYLSDGLHPYLIPGKELVGNKIAAFINANL